MRAVKCIVPAITLVLRGTAEFVRQSKRRKIPDNIHTLIMCSGWEQLGNKPYSLPGIRKVVTRRQWFCQVMGIQE